MLSIGVYDDNMNVADASDRCDELRDLLPKLRETIRRKKATLGVTEQARLTSLIGNQFLRLRMNARALKSRIRDRLRQRKFELERLERAYRKTSNGKFMYYNLVKNSTDRYIFREKTPQPHTKSGEKKRTRHYTIGNQI